MFGAVRPGPIAVGGMVAPLWRSVFLPVGAAPPDRGTADRIGGADGGLEQSPEPRVGMPGARDGIAREAISQSLRPDMSKRAGHELRRLSADVRSRAAW